MFQGLSYEPFKEPRGFLKILQWLFAICAFATTVNFSSISSVDLLCNSPNTTSTQVNLNHTIQYPFDLDQPHNLLAVKECKPGTLPVPAPATSNDLMCGLVANAKSDSEFFVTTGVLSFLYATALIAIFLLADNMYTGSNRALLIDFVITLVFALFWLAGSSAWSHGLSGVRTGADPLNWQVYVNGTLSNGQVGNFEVSVCKEAVTGFKCTNVHGGAFGGIVISILFGFINFILWGANVWFLYKETPWFERRSNTETIPGTSGHA